VTVRRREAWNVIWSRASCAASMTQHRLVLSYGGADDGQPQTRPGLGGQCGLGGWQGCKAGMPLTSRVRGDGHVYKYKRRAADAATTAHIST
jgi:hypothetical protein